MSDVKLATPEYINVSFLVVILWGFFKDFIYLFLERGKEGEREGEKHQFVVASCVPLNWGHELQPRHVPY